MTFCSNCEAEVEQGGRKGLCGRCYWYLQRTGEQRPLVDRRLNEKLTPALADEIRRLYGRRGRGPTYLALAEQFGVDTSTVGLCVRHETWRSAGPETKSERSS